MVISWLKTLFSARPQANRKLKPRQRPRLEQLEDRLTPAGGPVVLMGIDAEDGGLGGHGPINVYQGLANNILKNVTNKGSGILVIGGGKSPSDDVTTFWNAVDSATPGGLTYVNGGSIATQSFAGFAMIAVVSDEFNTFFGGLTIAENNALSGRNTDIAAFVNGGGGLLGFSSSAFGPNGSAPFGYLAALGSFSFASVDYDDITPTASGLAVGVTDALDVCCWHDVFTSFPKFLTALANENGFGGGGTGQIAAIGGNNVTLGPAAPQTVLKVFNPVRWTYNAKTKIYNGMLTAVNVSGGVLNGPIYAVFNKLPHGVTLHNATGKTAQGRPYIAINVATVGVGAPVHLRLKVKNPLAKPFDTFFFAKGIEFTTAKPT